MDVLMGPTFTLDVPSSPPPYDSDPPTSDAAAPSYAFFPADSSDSSSSIGTPDQSDNDDDDDDENDAVSSKRNENDENNDDEEVHTKLKTLASLDSLEEALPIKRGLSNHYIGKSKSFSDLSQVNTVKELQKQENPFNKRRRVLMASKLKKRSSFYAWSNPKSMPLLPVHEDEDDYDDEEEEEKEKPKKVAPSSSSSSSSSQVPMSYVYHMRRSLGSFKCRSLSDLKEHDEEEEEEIEDEDNDD